MLNPFRPPELVKAETFKSLPKKFRIEGRTKWSGAILTARSPVPGKVMYGLAP